MAQWVRLWEDMPNDPKWRVVRFRALQSVTDVSLGDVVLVFVHLMINAAQNNGHVEGWSDEDIAAAMELKTEQIAAIRVAMQGKVIDGNHLTGWEKRQPKREDNSAERVRAFRERRNALKHDVTQRNAPDTDTEKKKTNPSGLQKKKCFTAKSSGMESRSSGGMESRQKPRKIKTEIANGSQPDEADLAFAANAGMESRQVLDEWAQFRDHHLKNGSKFVDWNAAWRTWARNWKNHRRKRDGPAGRSNGLEGYLRMVQQDIEKDERNNASGDENRGAESTCRDVRLLQFGR